MQIVELSGCTTKFLNSIMRRFWFCSNTCMRTRSAKLLRKLIQNHVIRPEVKMGFERYWLSLSSIIICFSDIASKYILSSNVPFENDLHEVVFAIRVPDISISLQKNFRQIPKTIDYLNPAHDGRMLNRTSFKKLLLEYEADIVQETTTGDFVVARAKISSWDRFFSTTFRVFSDVSGIRHSVYRALTYSLLDEVASIILAVFNVVESPIYVPQLLEAKLSLNDLRIDRPSESEARVHIYGTKSFIKTVVDIGSTQSTVPMRYNVDNFLNM